jgi:hypothetical protein
MSASRGLPAPGRVPAGGFPAGWVWPWWRERQPEPSGENHTARDWTRIGTLGSPDRATVDPRGLLTPRHGGWSLDWWIGAEDRWHLPSREAAVRQALVGGAPVVETRMRIPGGEAVARAWAWESPGNGSQAVLEVDNRSATPVAVGFAVRPANVEGPAAIGRIEARGRTLLVDGRPAVIFPAPPRQVLLSTRALGDVLDLLQAASSDRGPRADDGADPVAITVDDPDGWATAVAVVPVAHRTLVRVVVPLSAPPDPPRRRRRFRPGSGPVAPESPDFTPASLPAGEAVAAGWTTQVAHGIRIEWPEGLLGEAVEAQRRHLALSDLRPTVGPPGPAPGRPGVGDAMVVAAWGTTGATDAADRWLTRWVDAQRGDGSLGPDATATAAVLWSLELHLALGGKVRADAPALAAAAEFVARAPVARRAAPSGPGAVAPEAWAAAGLAAAARLLEALGEVGAATTARRWAADHLEAIPPSNDAREPPGDGDILEELTAADLGLRPAGGSARPPWTPLPDATFLPSTRPAVGLLEARVGLRAGHPDALARLDALVASGAPTWRWADEVDPVSGAGVGGDGHSAAAAAGMWATGRDLLVRDQPGPDGTAARPPGPGGAARPVLAVCTWFPPAWRGQELEVHGLPTRAGLLSYAIRWHGQRPALLWEVAGPGAEVRLTAPGLDPAWTATGRRGEALLAPAG